jgi:methyl-accepting chemotaxis protein
MNTEKGSNNMIKNLKLNQKIIAVLLIASLVPFITISLFSYIMASNSLHNETAKKLDLFEEQKKEDLKVLFDGSKADCQSIASTSTIFSALNVHRTVGGNTASAEWKQTEATLLVLFKQIKNTYHSDLINLFDKNGKIVYSTDTSLIGKDLSERVYFKSAIQGNLNNSPFFYSDLVKDNVTAFAAPVYANGENGEIIGVFSTVLKTSDITSRITTNMDIMGTSADAYLIDGDGTLIIKPKFGNFEPFKDKIESKAFELLSPAIKSKNISFEGMDEYKDYRKVKVLGKFSTIVLGDLNIGLITEIDSEEAFGSSNKLGIITLIISVISILFIILFGFIFSRKLSNPIIKLQELMSVAEKGDLTVRGKIQSNDEIGMLTGSFNSLCEKTSEMIKNIYESTVILNKSSDNLLQVSESMAANSEETNAKTTVVSATIEEISAGMLQTATVLADTSGNVNVIASAVEEMSGTIRNLASAAEQTSSGVGQVSELVTQISGSISNASTSSMDVSGSVNSVATAVKEINLSLNEISKNCERSIYITSDADSKAKDTNSIIEKLNNSSKQIGKIVNVINDIADQTNMLALNAAIEAAGAGEAGKGFAVVANEVKELAKQTADATDEIGQQIEAMQSNMSGAVKSVETITNVIKEITEITNTIAAAVTEQSATTGDISNAIIKAAEKVNLITKEISDIASNSQNVARSITEASKGVSEIARSASELSSASNEVAQNSERASIRVQEVARTSQEISKGANEISQNIQEISAASSDTATGAMATTHSAKGLTDTAVKLETLVKQFKI